MQKILYKLQNACPEVFPGMRSAAFLSSSSGALGTLKNFLFQRRNFLAKQESICMNTYLRTGKMSLTHGCRISGALYLVFGPRTLFYRAYAMEGYR